MIDQKVMSQWKDVALCVIYALKTVVERQFLSRPDVPARDPVYYSERWEPWHWVIYFKAHYACEATRLNVAKFKHGRVRG